MTYIPILMTASVCTHGMKGACFSDHEREKMYIDAISYYINNILNKDSNQRIVFAENSGWDLSKIKENLSEYDIDRIEWISLDPKDFDITKGKGFNEVILINKAVEQSKFIQDNQCFFKVTGRYPIYNLQYFLKAAKKRFADDKDIYCDIKDHKLYDILKLGWNGHSFDCRLFAIKVPVWQKYFAPYFTECDDFKEHCLLEDVMFAKLKLIPNKKSCRRFRREPHFGGLEGSNIQSVSFSKNQDSIKSKIKRCVGNTVRTALPWFWF